MFSSGKFGEVMTKILEKWMILVKFGGSRRRRFGEFSRGQIAYGWGKWVGGLHYGRGRARV